jgi:hypothetical protein
MPGNGKWRLCACGCGRKFRSHLKTRKYFEYACKNKDAQRRLRDRAKKYHEMNAEQNGAMGA